MEIGRSLKQTFAKAAKTKLGEAFIRHAGKTACVSFFATDLVLGLKDYVQGGHIPNLNEQISASLFFTTDILMAASDRYPKVKPYIGWFMMAGAGFLGYSGMGSEGQNAQLFSSSLIGLQSLSFVFERQLQNTVSKSQKIEHGYLKRLFNPLAKYPLVTMAAVDIVGKVALGAAALQKGDVGLLAVSGLAILGNIAVMAMDNNVKALVATKVTEVTPVP